MAISLKGKTYPHPRSVRLALARFIEDFKSGRSECDVTEFKAIVASYETILKALKQEKDVDIERRIAELEERLRGEHV